MVDEIKLVYGWGINDIGHTIKGRCLSTSDQETLLYECYKDWSDIIRRCHDSKYLSKYPTYIGCTICDEWKYLSNFVRWVDSQPNKDWFNCIPDKDFLSIGGKFYSPETVVYIPQGLNKFITDRGRFRGNLMIGVGDASYKRPSNIYSSRCCNPFTNKRCNIGYFTTELEAHKAWQAKKHEYACALADLQDDPRVADALRQRYAPDKDWTNR